MRTNIEIDDALIREALRLTGLKTQRAVVEAGLKALVRLNRQRKTPIWSTRFIGRAIWTKAGRAASLRDTRRYLGVDRPPASLGHGAGLVSALTDFDAGICIERGHTLLHSDRDFAPMESLLGLQTL
jgi:hypothetical protein